MRARVLAGKTIKRVIQKRWSRGDGSRDDVVVYPVEWVLDAIEFTDGTVLRFLVREGDVEHAIELIYPAREV